MTATSPLEREPTGLAQEGRAGADVAGRAPGVPAICPFLTGGDGSWRGAEASRLHTCGAVEPRAVLAVSKQRQLCLGAGHDACATFRAAIDLLTPQPQGPFETGLWPRTSSRVLTLEPVRAGLAGGLTTPQARAGGQALLVGLIVIAFAVLVIARTTPPSSGPAAGPASPAPTASVSSGAVGRAQPAVSPAPTSGAGTSAAPASPVATPAAAASGGEDRTYKVKRGDTLSGIALTFGVTVKALRRANGLKAGDVIRPGQVLVIPVPVATSTP